MPKVATEKKQKEITTTSVLKCDSLNCNSEVFENHAEVPITR